MAPFSMNCSTCGNWIAKSTKFNARKELAVGHEYLGIRVFRFYIRCPRCSAEITFRTDPKNTDYVCEQGAVRNFEPWKDNRLSAEEEKEERAAEEENNPMKALENRAVDSKREMDILDALDEIRTRNALNERVDAEALLDKLHARKLKDSGIDDAELLEKLLEEEDEAYARAIFGGGGGPSSNSKEPKRKGAVPIAATAGDGSDDEYEEDNDDHFEQGGGEEEDGASLAAAAASASASAPTFIAGVKRLAPDEEDMDEEARLKKLRSKFGGGELTGPEAAVKPKNNGLVKPAAAAAKPMVALVAPKKKLEGLVVPAKPKASAPAAAPAKAAPAAASALGGLAAYADSDEDDAD